MPRRVTLRALLENRETRIAALAIAGIAIHLALRASLGVERMSGPVRLVDLPLLAVLLFGGVPLVATLLGQLFRREFGSDLLAGVSIVTSVVLDEYLAGALVVLMLSGGEALMHAIRQIKAEGRLVIIMAHRPAAISECDLLLVVHEGAVQAFGPRDEVLREQVRNHATLLRPQAEARPQPEVRGPQAEAQA